jgi:hypothetical protein
LDIAKTRLERFEAASSAGVSSNAGDARCWLSSAMIRDFRSGDLRSALCCDDDDAEYLVGVERKLSRVDPLCDTLSES